MRFCIRDDDTSAFTSPDELERVYGEVSRLGPVSLAVVPFHRAGTSQGVPRHLRGRWSVHPLHDNAALVDYLRRGVAEGRFEIMLHGFWHDERDGRPEFANRQGLTARVSDGRQYLEELLGTTIRVFVPPHNTIGRLGLQAIARCGLHLGCAAGLRRGWSPVSRNTWREWRRLLRWRRRGGTGVPWVLDLGDHREIAGNPVTPAVRPERNEAVFESALRLGGVFCAATHYWEHDAPSVHRGAPPVGEQLRALVDRAVATPDVRWERVGDVVADGGAAYVRIPRGVAG